MASEEDIAYQVVLEPYTSVSTVIVFPIAFLSSMFLLYGMYIIIFGLSINILWRRRESSASKAYMRWIIALFVLTTINNVFGVRTNMDQILVAFNAIKSEDYVPLFKLIWGENSVSERAAWWGLSALTSGMIGCIFDYLMVHRCYVIWGHSKRILYPFAFVAIVTNVIGFVALAVMIAGYRHHNTVIYERSIAITQVAIIITAVYSSLLTLLTAGRIWLMTRQARQITRSDVYNKHKIFVATILETGLIFSITQVVTVILHLVTDSENKGVAPFDSGTISVHMAAIAPTLIVLRIAYGQSVDSVQQMVSTVQFAERGNSNSQQHSAAVRHGTIDLQQSLAEVEERGTLGRFEMDKPPSNPAQSVV
ncbi:hypothetical protein PQX77_016312 [Marasmius sp. AFHP31]|nr:hypothetical protein PQX77_016312 [Marasmius sp. AFHP31]